MIIDAKHHGKSACTFGTMECVNEKELKQATRKKSIKILCTPKKREPGEKKKLIKNQVRKAVLLTEKRLCSKSKQKATNKNSEH